MCTRQPKNVKCSLGAWLLTLCMALWRTSMQLQRVRSTRRAGGFLGVPGLHIIKTKKPYAPPESSGGGGARVTGSTGNSSTTPPPGGMKNALDSAPPCGPTATRTRAQYASSAGRLAWSACRKTCKYSKAWVRVHFHYKDV